VARARCGLASLASVRRSGSVLLIALSALLALPAVAGAQIFAGQNPTAIPGFSTGSPDDFIGPAATAHRVRGTHVPRHPHMAPNGISNIHNDAFETDSYLWSGPLGDSPEVTSAFFSHECASITFDREHRLVAICVGLDRPVLAVLDPVTLHVFATMDLPPRPPSTNPFQDFSGGGYFYLDEHDRAVVPTSDHHILVVRETPGPGLAVAHDYDLTAAVPSSDAIIAVMPDWRGRPWFVTRAGIVGNVKRRTGKVSIDDTGEPIGNSFAVGARRGVYIVTDKAMYKFIRDSKGGPSVKWRRKYPNIGVKKPGQTEKGSGTTPTLFGPGLVAITDNADPMDVVVYDRHSGRQVCSQPVFKKGTSDSDQSLVAARHSLIVENNYGYTGPASTNEGTTTTPGLERVDVRAGDCSRVWRSHEIAPSAVPKLSLGAGVVYTWTKPVTSDNTDPWYFTALDFRTGKTLYKQLAGNGLGFNNNYAPITIAPTGVAYVGVLGGLVRLADTP
jgi:hypothetical protein